MSNNIHQLHGANMDIDLTSKDNISWHQDQCSWNQAEKTNTHKCAVKSTSICDYFCGIKILDTVLCSYPYKLSVKKSNDRQKSSSCLY
jgi:hypothetical protein